MKSFSGNQRSFKLREVFCFVLILGMIQSALDPKVALPLSTLPADLRLASVVPAGVDNTTCKGFWSKTGYVCDKAKTIAYAKNDQNKLVQEEQTFAKAMDKFERAWIISESDYLKTSPSSKKVHQLVLNDLKNVNKASGSCWTHLQALRTSSLCTTCSALNYRFYKDKLLGLSQTDCTSLLKSCNSFIIRLYLLAIHAFQRLPSVLEAARGPASPPSAYLKKFAQGTSSVAAALELLDLTRGFKFGKCIKLKQNQIETSPKLVCEKMVSLHRTSALVKLTRFFAGAADAFLSEYSQLTGRSLGIEASKSRSLLQTATGITANPDQEVTVLIDNPLTQADDKSASVSGTATFNSALTLW
jgi:hypothetical protein